MSSGGGETLAVAIPLNTTCARSCASSRWWAFPGHGQVRCREHVMCDQGPVRVRGQGPVPGRSHTCRAKSPCSRQGPCRGQGRLNPQYLHTPGSTAMNKPFAMAQCQYRLKCTSMAVIAPVGSHEDMGTPMSQAGASHRSAFKPPNRSAAMGPTPAAPKRRSVNRS